MIVPGFVNAHSHLEYAVYGGFGDGLGDFAEWITLHIQRKARIGWEEYVDVARFGAAQCLASGVTTVGDCSYSGATAVACAELGLRATIYLEVFGGDPPKALEHFAGLRDRVGDSFSERVVRNVRDPGFRTHDADLHRVPAGASTRPPAARSRSSSWRSGSRCSPPRRSAAVAAARPVAVNSLRPAPRVRARARHDPGARRARRPDRTGDRAPALRARVLVPARGRRRRCRRSRSCGRRCDTAAYSAAAAVLATAAARSGRAPRRAPPKRVDASRSSGRPTSSRRCPASSSPSSFVYFTVNYASGLYLERRSSSIAYAIDVLPARSRRRPGRGRPGPARARGGRALARARPASVLVRVTLPILAPALAAGVLARLHQRLDGADRDADPPPERGRHAGDGFWAFTKDFSYGAAAPYALALLLVATMSRAAARPLVRADCRRCVVSGALGRVVSSLSKSFGDRRCSTASSLEVEAGSLWRSSARPEAARRRCCG